MVSIELTPAVPEIRRGNPLKYEVSTLMGHFKIKANWWGGGPTTTTTTTTVTTITNNLAKRFVTPCSLKMHQDLN